MVDEVRLECSGGRDFLVLAGRRVGGSDWRVGGSRFNTVDGDAAVFPRFAIRIGYIFVVHSSRNFEPEKVKVEVFNLALSFRSLAR